MKSLLLLSCMLSLGAAAPIASAAPSTGIPFFHRHKKDAAASATAPKPKTKRSFLHHAESSREEAARSEAAFGMTGPQSVGLWHPQPGPAGVGAK